MLNVVQVITVKLELSFALLLLVLLQVDLLPAAVVDLQVFLLLAHHQAVEFLHPLPVLLQVDLLLVLPAVVHPLLPLAPRPAVILLAI